MVILSSLNLISIFGHFRPFFGFSPKSQKKTREIFRPFFGFGVFRFRRNSHTSISEGEANAVCKGDLDKNKARQSL